MNSEIVIEPDRMTHIRKTNPNPRRYGGHRRSSGGRASADTICGAEPTIYDLQWREAKADPASVTCHACRREVGVRASLVYDLLHYGH